MAIRVKEDRLFILDTAHTTYAFAIDGNGNARHLYYGATISREQDLQGTLESTGAMQEELSSFGCLRLKETAMHVAYANGTRDFRSRMDGYSINGDELRVRLADREYGFAVELVYTVYPQEDIIARKAVYQNTGEEQVLLRRAFSMELPLPGEGYHALNFAGTWAREHQLHMESLGAGKRVYESVAGTTGFNAQPVFAASRHATEREGEVYFGALSYSGNFKVIAEAEPEGFLSVMLGINDTDFSLHLARGERFETPAAFLGFTRNGLGGMSRTLHAFARRYLMHSDKLLPVLYNSWYATTFDVLGAEQEKLADKAAQLGVELFVIDDGWFGERNSDRAGLGDWVVNERKFPDGLNHLIGHVHGLGMEFGLWIEPEMTNPDSDLYRAHPDWVYSYPKREIITGRNQYTLNMTRNDVVEHLFGVFDRLLSEYGIDYIKWDMNRSMAEATDACREDGMVWHDHIEGVMRLARELRRRHPDVSFEACAGGGARVNYQTLELFDQFWPSDNVDPLDRCAIQEGYSMFYPPKYMRAWIVDDSGWGDGAHVPLKLRTRCAMCGSFGIGTNLNANTPAELEVLRQEIALYKQIRPIVQYGLLYRLASLNAGGAQIWQYVHERRSALIVLTDHLRKALGEIRLQGLEEEAVYHITGTEGTDRMASGAWLMNNGLKVRCARDRGAEVLILEKVD